MVEKLMIHHIDSKKMSQEYLPKYIFNNLLLNTLFFLNISNKLMVAIS